MGKHLEQVWAPPGAKIMVSQWAQQNDSQPQTHEYKNKVFLLVSHWDFKIVMHQKLTDTKRCWVW